MSTAPLRRALASRAFRRFFAARTISQWGDTFNAVALVILVYRLTGSGLDVGATVIFEIVPVLAFGFVAGVVVDRFSRVAVMVCADLARTAIAVGLAVFHHDLLVVYGSAFGFASFSAFFNPAAASLLPALVEPDEVLGANSALWSAAVFSQIALAPLAGVLVASAGAGPAFSVNAGSFVMSAVLLSGVRVAGAPRGVAARTMKDLTAGVRIVGRDRFLSTQAVVHVLAALSAGATSALLVVLAERQLRVGATRFGVLLGAIGVGAVLGSLVLVRMVRDVRRPIWLFGPYALRGVVDLVLASIDSFGTALGALACYGIATSTGNIAYNTTLQRVVADGVRGRVFAFYDVLWATARLASIGIGGVLADMLGISAVYYLGGVLLLVAAATGLLRVGRDEIVVVSNDEFPPDVGMAEGDGAAVGH